MGEKFYALNRSNSYERSFKCPSTLMRTRLVLSRKNCRHVSSSKRQSEVGEIYIAIKTSFWYLMSPVLLLQCSTPPGSSLWSAAKHSDSFSKGVTAVIHRCLFMHWTAVWAKSEQLRLTPVRSSEWKEVHQTSYLNTLLYSSEMVHEELPQSRSWNLAVMAIQLKHSTKVRTKVETLQNAQ